MPFAFCAQFQLCSQSLFLLIPYLLKDIMRNCKFGTRQRDDIIIKQGEVGDCFYVVLSGQISIYIHNQDKGDEEERKELENIVQYKDGKLDRTKLGNFALSLGEGSPVGEVALIDEAAVRTATIVADQKTDLLIIDRPLYNRCIKDMLALEFEEKKKFICNSPLFASWAPKYRKQLAMALYKENYPYESLLVRQGDRVAFAYFIIRGQVEIQIDPSTHPAQYPKIFKAANENEAEKLMRKSDKPRPPTEVNYSHHIRKRDNLKSARLCYLGMNESVGDTELTMELDTYLQTAVCKEQTEVLVLERQHYERLFVRRHPRTIDTMRQQIKMKLLTRKSLSSAKDIPFLGYLAQEIVNKDGSAKVNTFRIPSIGQSSVYHEPQHLASLALTESSLNRHNRTGDVWKGGPYPHYESINGQNRQAVLSQLVQVYNADIAQVASHSHQALCRAASKVSTAGLPSLQVSPTELQSWPVTNGPRPKVNSHRHSARISVSPALLIEMLWGLNFAMYNGCEKQARDAVRDVHARACYELLPDVQLVTEAILNCDCLTQGGMGDAGPMGISLATAAATPNPILAKTITNASFKTKKLPDDIPVAEVDSPQAMSKLSPIEEEHKGLAKHMQRLSKGRNKKEDKEKEKEKRGRDARRGSDTSSSKSLVLNGESLDSVNVSIVKKQSRDTVDSVELLHLGRMRYSDDHPVTNGNNSAHKAGERGGGEGEVRSRPNSFHGAVVNPESFSTDL
ncbi:uncharacterized protein [Littorina saxatilis]|uniref:uncharacterized protein n=1 Tax=Littorina saxatilis TaxID=31220 RepID=UPI0038B61D09